MRIVPPDTRNLAVGHDATHPRLTFTPRPTRNGEMDGRWWPRTDDLAVELPALLAAVAHRVGTVDRISLDPETWANRARTVTIDDRVILLDWFGARHSHTVGLRGAHSSHLDLLVIPPNTATIVALACLTMQTLATSPPEREQESRWEDDGGRDREPSPTLVGAARPAADEAGQTDSW
ncbi:DUF5994 family protein [Pseudonocardia saturnea]